jgi:hypothetical protein
MPDWVTMEWKYCEGKQEKVYVIADREVLRNDERYVFYCEVDRVSSCWSRLRIYRQTLQLPDS